MADDNPFKPKVSNAKQKPIVNVKNNLHTIKRDMTSLKNDLQCIKSDILLIKEYIRKEQVKKQIEEQELIKQENEYVHQSKGWWFS